MFASMAKSSTLRQVVLGMVCLTACLVHSVHSACLCTVPKSGEYCGTQLNEINPANNCPKKMFFCGVTNRDKEAVLLVDCPDGSECDIKTFYHVLTMSNACLKQVKCGCPSGLKSGQTYCGSELEGTDCSPNVTMTCPYLSFFLPTVVDGCLYGCKDGACLPPSGASSALKQ